MEYQFSHSQLVGIWLQDTRVFLYTFIVVYLFKSYPLLCNQKVLHLLQKSLPFDPSLGHSNPLHTFTSMSLTDFNIILVLPFFLYSWDLVTLLCVCVSSFFLAWYTLTQFILGSVTLTISFEELTWTFSRLQNTVTQSPGVHWLCNFASRPQNSHLSNGICFSFFLSDL